MRGVSVLVVTSRSAKRRPFAERTATKRGPRILSGVTRQRALGVAGFIGEGSGNVVGVDWGRGGPLDRISICMTTASPESDRGAWWQRGVATLTTQMRTTPGRGAAEATDNSPFGFRPSSTFAIFLSILAESCPSLLRCVLSPAILCRVNQKKRTSAKKQIGHPIRIGDCDEETTDACFGTDHGVGNIG